MLLHQPYFSSDGNVCNLTLHGNHSWDFHFHKNFEILYVIEGAIECTINNKTDVIREGEFCMCLSNEIHSGHTVGDTKFWAFIFSEDFVHSFAKLAKGKEGDEIKFTCRESVRKYIEDVFLNNDEQEHISQKACLYALTGEYLSCVKLIDKKKAKSETMTEIVDYISQNYMNNITLSDVAEILNYDYHYVSRLFHQLFNMSFKNFLNIYRLERAVEMMKNGEQKLLNIAYESGFQSIRTFNSCFKNYFGTNPTEYMRSGR